VSEQVSVLDTRADRLQPQSVEHRAEVNRFFISAGNAGRAKSGGA